MEAWKSLLSMFGLLNALIGDSSALINATVRLSLNQTVYLLMILIFSLFRTVETESSAGTRYGTTPIVGLMRTAEIRLHHLV
jgi:hypothetical protein